MPRVAAVIVTHNRKEKLLRCIEAVLVQDSEVLPDIFIVDNDIGLCDFNKWVVLRASFRLK